MTARRLTTFYSTAWRNHELSYRPSHAPEHTARGMTAIADSWYNPEGYTGKQDMTRSSVFTTNHAGRVAAVRAGRSPVNRMRQSGAKALSVSSVTNPMGPFAHRAPLPKESMPCDENLRAPLPLSSSAH